MRRSSSIRCLSEVIGETSSDDKIRNRARKEGPRARRTGASQLPRSGLVQWAISVANWTLPLAREDLKRDAETAGFSERTPAGLPKRQEVMSDNGKIMALL